MSKFRSLVSVSFKLLDSVKKHIDEIEYVNGVPCRIGTLTYEFLSIRFDWRSILDFCEKWNVQRFDIGVEGEELRKNQFKLARACMLWLSRRKTPQKSTLLGDYEYEPPQMPAMARMGMYPLRREIDATIIFGATSCKSRRTHDRREETKRDLLGELAECKRKQEQIQEVLSEKTADLMFDPRYLGNWNDEYKRELEAATKEESGELDRLVKKENDLKRQLAEATYGDCTTPMITYEVGDVLDACWLEVFTAVQLDVTAVQCTICRRWHMVANTKQTVCPECNKTQALRRKLYRRLDKIKEETGSNDTRKLIPPWPWES